MTSTSIQRQRHLDNALVAADAVGAQNGWQAKDIVDAAQLFEAYVEGDNHTPKTVPGTIAELAVDVRYDDQDWRRWLLQVLLTRVAEGWQTLSDDITVHEIPMTMDRAVLEGDTGKAIFWANSVVPPGVDSTHLVEKLWEVPTNCRATFKVELEEKVFVAGEHLEGMLEEVIADANRQLGAGITACIDRLVTASGRPREMGDITFFWSEGWMAKEYSNGRGTWSFEGGRQYGVALVPK